MSKPYTNSDYPYLIWMKSHIQINRYNPHCTYNKGDEVTMGRSIYRSTADNNKNNNPITSTNWVQIA